MQTQVTELARVRKQLAKAQEDYAAELALFQEKHSATLKEIEELKETEAALSAEIKPLAEAEFKRTGEKKLFGGVGIKVGKDKVRYEYDQSKALEFAKEKDMFLALDVKAFEAAIPGLNADFVKPITIPGSITVTFPKEFNV